MTAICTLLDRTRALGTFVVQLWYAFCLVSRGRVMGEIIQMRWLISEGGGVTADFRRYLDGGIEVWTKFFKNLERMPGRLADAIREDGRPVGTLSVIITKGAG